MDLRISATAISSCDNPRLKSFRAVNNCEKCLSCENGLSVQFCCNIDVRLGSALASRGNDRGFDDRLVERYIFLVVIELSATI